MTLYDSIGFFQLQLPWGCDSWGGVPMEILRIYKLSNIFHMDARKTTAIKLNWNLFQDMQ